jgi:hypothetical protein
MTARDAQRISQATKASFLVDMGSGAFLPPLCISFHIGCPVLPACAQHPTYSLQLIQS